MYRPKFCSECGERVERERWRVWTSRRFCAACDARFRKRRVVSSLAAAACLVALGFLTGRAGRTKPPPLTILRGDQAAPGNPAAQAADGKLGVTDEDAASGARGGARLTDPLEVVSLCGARTKKGTPCSRRVRGTGRCWQHRGKPAMLPPEKLIVTGS